MRIKTGKQNLPRRMLIYGENGIGKSRIAAAFPKPLFINLEDGLGDIECDKTDRLTDFGDIVTAISWLCTEPHKYQTVVIDTADWLEKLVFRAVAKDKGKATIEDIGFGKGYDGAAEKWQFLISGLTHLWRQPCDQFPNGRGMHVVFTCHLKIAKFADPAGETYNYYSPDLNEKGSGCICQWCDEVLFATTKVYTITKDEGFGSKRTIAVDSDQRILLTHESPSRVAKERLGLAPEVPFSLPFDFDGIIGKHLRTSLAVAGNISGVVVEGSSKSESKKAG